MNTSINLNANHMKTLLTILTVLYCFNLSAQVKIWNQSGKPQKTKGTMYHLNTTHQEGDILKFAAIPGFTIAGTLLPYAIKFGINTVKSITAKNEADYKKEYSSINGIELPEKQVLKGNAIFESYVSCYKKGENTLSTVAKYQFETSFNTTERVLTIKLQEKNIQEKYLPVKTKKKYDLVMEVFEFTIVANSTLPASGGKTVTQITELGTAKLTRVVPSYRLKDRSTVENYDGNIFIPSHTKDGKEIDYKSIMIIGGAKFVNPIGTTQGALNAFLENNSEAIEGLLNLTVKSE